MEQIVMFAIQSIITILGFVITYLGIRLNLKNELMSRKTGLHIDRMTEIPYTILDLMNKGNDNKNKVENVTVEDFNKLLTTIYAYGSKDAIRITALLQKENYLEVLQENKYRMLAIYPLLANQIKYDITGIAITSDFWFDMKINDYNKDKIIHNALIEENNKLVRKLKLNERFYISKDKVMK